MSNRPGIPRLGWVLAFFGAVILATLAHSSFKATRPVPVPAHLEPVAPVPDFQLLDQNGKPFGLADLQGKIWVANFIFTRCKGPCPLISSRMAELHRMTGRADKDLELVTFSIDPEFDRPDVLAVHANTLGADSSKWKFLTGKREEIENLVVRGLLQPLAKEPDGTPAHSTRFVLVDRNGVLRGFQDGSDPEVVQKLLMDIGDLLRENPSKTQ